jgi:hypothetical protein
MPDQIATLYQSSGLTQAQLTTGVTLATAGANETVTIRDIQIDNPNNRVLDLKIGNTTIATNGGSTTYSGIEYLGPGQSLTLNYRTGTYPPAAAAAPTVYCNRFELLNTNGRTVFHYNDAQRNANTVIPWSNSSVYFGTFSRDNTTPRNGSFSDAGSSHRLWVPVSATDHYLQWQGSWLNRYPAAVSASTTMTQLSYTATWNGQTGAAIGCSAYDGSRFIYGISSTAYNNNTDNIWGHYLKVDTQNNGSIQQIPFQAENYYDFMMTYYDNMQGSGSIGNHGQKHVGWHYAESQACGQFLDGYYLVKPNQNHPFILINTTTNRFRNLRFGKNHGFNNWTEGTCYFAKAVNGDYIVGHYTGDWGEQRSSAPYFNTFDWWNIGPNLAEPKVINSGTFRVRNDDDYNFIPYSLQATRDPNNPQFYYVMARGSHQSNTSDINTAKNNNYFKIVDFTFGFPIFRDIRAVNPQGFGSNYQQQSVAPGYIIPSLTNYTYAAPATPAFGTVDIRVAGIRSSI